jgi:hypothetical protein
MLIVAMYVLLKTVYVHPCISVHACRTCTRIIVSIGTIIQREGSESIASPRLFFLLPPIGKISPLLHDIHIVQKMTLD